MKTEGVLLPVKASDRKLGKKFHSYEKTIIHPERNVERLPTNNFKILEDPPFKLQSGYVRNCIRCSNKDCRKPRLVFKQKKASKNEMNEFFESIENLKWTCGDRIDDSRNWVVKERLTCKDHVEGSYYTQIVDKGKVGMELVCYGCGEPLNSHLMKKYIDDKTIHESIHEGKPRNRSTA